MTHRWLARYPAEVPADVDPLSYRSFVELMLGSFERHASLPACRFMGRDVSFERIDHQSRALAAWLQGQGLARGDRVAVMVPNLPQYAVAVAAILRAGMVVVRVNPLHTLRDLGHQLRDSGARGIVVLENFASTLQQVLPQVPVRTIVVAAAGDMLGLLRGSLANHVARRIRRAVPPFELPGAVGFVDAVARGRSLACTDPQLGPDDIAVLQYSGGTTGVSKGAVLLHRNLVASALQAEAWYGPALRRVPPGEQPVIVCAMPMHQATGFGLGLLLAWRTGACSLLATSARDIPALLGTLRGERFHALPADNTLFHALASHPDVGRVDWRPLVLSVAGGMAVQPATARLWAERTGCAICESYGLSETGGIASSQPAAAGAAPLLGSIGLPLPGTALRVEDDAGRECEPGVAGEIAVKGPQVMAGYWQRPDETARSMSADGFFRTGDIGVMEPDGSFRLVDRKKDLIHVDGCAVYPNEIEDVIASMPGVLEVGAVGVPDGPAGEAVKVVVVRKDRSIGESQVRAYARERLAAPQWPKIVEFRDELPKTAVGRILRRELRG